MKTYIKKTLDTHGDGKRSKNGLPKKQTVRWRLAHWRLIRGCSLELHLWKEREGTGPSTGRSSALVKGNKGLSPPNKSPELG